MIDGISRPDLDLTPEALAGFAAQLGDTPSLEACPHYTSSPAGMAGWSARGCTRPGAPRDVRMSRGYIVRVGDMRVSAADAAAPVRIQ